MTNGEEMQEWDKTLQFVRDNAAIHSRMFDVYEAASDVSFGIHQWFNDKISKAELIKKLMTLEARIYMLNEDYHDFDYCDEVISKTAEQLKEAKNDSKGVFETAD